MSPDRIEDRIEHLSPAKRALLEKLLKQKSAERGSPEGQSAVTGDGDALASMPKRAQFRSVALRDPASPAPLSFGQQRLWFLDQLDPGNSFYNVSAAVRLEGPLEAGVLHRSLNLVVERHQALRTTFPSDSGVAWQHIAPRLPAQWHEVDLTGLPAEAIEAELARLAAAEANRAFDLTRGPLVRATLFKLAPERHVLMLVLHHIICDGWSLAVLRFEVAARYDAFRRGEACTLPELKLQYADFAAWQRKMIEGELAHSQLAYWRNRLQGSPPWLELPLDLPRPSVQTFRGATVRRQLPGSLSASLRRFAREENCTLFMVLIAAWQVLLSRVSGGRDIWVGTPIAGRTRAEFEPLIGFFVNTLVLRSEIELEAGFKPLLAEVRKHMLDAYAHQDLPFEELVEAIQPERDLSRTPLFQTMFVLQNAPVASHRLADLAIADIELGHVQAANFDLTLNVSEADQLDLLLVYNRDLFLPDTATRLLNTFETLLTAITRGPERPLGSLPLLDTAQRRRQLIQWNSPGSQQRPGHLARAFEEQAARTPGAVAVELDNTRWTYAELDRRANQVAHYLLEQRTQPETSVGLCFERCPEMLAAMFGILKAGAAYVPLDPSWPAARLKSMASDAGMQHILSHTPAAAQLRAAYAADNDLATREMLSHYSGEPLAATEGLAGEQPEIICLDTLDTLQSLPETSPAVDYRDDSLAYLIFTSGSTGRPKGVEVPHAGLVNHARVMIETCNISVGDRMLQYLSPSFDAAGEEIFPTLLSGATLVLHPTPLELSGEEIMHWSRERRVNFVHMPPSVWAQVLDLAERDPQAAQHLRTFMTGGDSMPTKKVKRWLELTRVPIVYAYGVTEASITTTLYVARDPEQLPQRDRLPIGRPIPGNEAYVLDAQLQPLPVGVVGELVLGGIGVARGYRQSPRLTAERFVAHPFMRATSEKGAAASSDNPDGQPASSTQPRVYRTGDLARYLPDGTIEFLGRQDHQVKIRGYRIELGEIETALLRHGAIAECAVIAREDQPGRKRLVAYYALEPTASDDLPQGKPAGPAISELLEHLERHLPAYMLPSAFVALDKLPREHHGRVARERLPAPDTSRPALRASYAPPQTEVETTLAQIWREVLHIDQVGRHDNFFELGGDSILTIQVIARASAAGLRLTPKQLFLNQTIAELAQVAGSGPAVIAPQGEVTGHAPLTPIQCEMLAQPLANLHHFNQAVMLTPTADLTASMVDTALRRLVMHHDVLRLRLRRGAYVKAPALNTGVSQEIVPVAEVNLDDLLWRYDLGQTQQPLSQVAAEVQASLNAEQGPLLRAAWMEGVKSNKDPGKSNARLLIAIHHLAVDAVSWRILLEDLQVICQGMSHTLDPPLPPKTSSFADWGVRLETEAASPRRQLELAYWLDVLRVPGALPVDRPEGPNRARDIARAQGSLSAAETQSLLHNVPTAYRMQVHETLLAALSLTLASWTTYRRWRIDLEGHGRADLDEQFDLSRTVGWFTTLFPVQIRALAPNDLRQTLIDTKECLRQVPDGGLGYGLLRWLCPEPSVRESLRKTPKEPAALCFNYLGQFDQTLPAGALLRLADEPAGPLYAKENVRRHGIELISHIRGGQLHVEWVYSREQYDAATIERVAGDLLQQLRKLIAHCETADAGAATPSDFPLAQLDAEDLESLSALLGEDDDADDE